MINAKPKGKPQGDLNKLGKQFVGNFTRNSVDLMVMGLYIYIIIIPSISWAIEDPQPRAKCKSGLNNSGLVG